MLQGAEWVNENLEITGQENNDAFMTRRIAMVCYTGHGNMNDICKKTSEDNHKSMAFVNFMN